MKNIHILPTDKPSRLRYWCGDLELNSLSLAKKLDDGVEFQNIYITSDEEIKEGDWGFDGLHIFKCLKPFIANETTSGKNIPCFYIELDGKSNTFHETSYIKKIILTTDQSLEGVQAIDDDFLEWFVKNPSCESVKVDKEYNEERIVDGKDIGDYSYKIIIPNEEAKQETLEEAAEEYYNNNIFCDLITKFEHDIAIRCYIAGAKWQQERVYTRKELREVIEQYQDFIESNSLLTTDQWFEQNVK